MLMKFGCKVIGETEDFYDEPVTLITLNKIKFIKNIHSSANEDTSFKV